MMGADKKKVGSEASFRDCMLSFWLERRSCRQTKTAAAAIAVRVRLAFVKEPSCSLALGKAFEECPVDSDAACSRPAWK